MKVLFAAAEAYPLAKVGGLGDVAGSLPQALRALGHDVRIVMPRYGHIRAKTKDRGGFTVPIGGATHSARVRETRIGRVPVYLVDAPEFYDRARVYEHEDDGRRFAFLSRAILEVPPTVDFWPDVIHCNDWHTALAPGFLRSLAGDSRYRDIRTVLTIHNLQHQGAFGRDVAAWTGLPRRAWRSTRGGANFLAAGIAHADRVNTVSPTYAREIRTVEHGWGLDALLRRHAAKLSGILNGIDYRVWNPARDSHLAAPYSKSRLEGKAANKGALQAEVELPWDAAAPLIGIVSRIASQKGFDILLPALPAILKLGAQVVLLGTGDRRHERRLARLARRHTNLATLLTYDEALAHRIYAGSDLFLMPSQFEPCGLGQMISLRYGTVPVVRATGGLADTVTDVAATKDGNGFAFTEYTSEALLKAVGRGVAGYRQDRGWRTLQRRGMSADFSWGASAKAYAALYGEAVA